MNPLDKSEFPVILNTIQNDMPKHTDNTAHIPRTLYGYFPKNLMEFSSNVDNKFLNNNQHIIEEIQYRDPENEFVKLFRDYQQKYFLEFGVLSKDNFYKWVKEHPDEPMVRGASMATLSSLFTFSGSGVNKVNGAELVTNTATTNGGNSAGGIIAQTTSSSGVVGEYYDQIAISDANSVGNQRTACYDNSGSAPNAILAEYTSYALDSAYTYKSVTEFSLTTTTVWLAFQVQNGGSNAEPHYDGGGSCQFKAQVYGAFTTTGFGASSPKYRMKVGHT